MRGSVLFFSRKAHVRQLILLTGVVLEPTFSWKFAICVDFDIALSDASTWLLHTS